MVAFRCAIISLVVLAVVVEGHGRRKLLRRYVSAICPAIISNGLCSLSWRERSLPSCARRDISRCCEDPCRYVECCAPLTCDGGMCTCNGNVCGDDQTCTGSGVDAFCKNNCKDEDCVGSLTCDEGGLCTCNGNVCGDDQTCTGTGDGASCTDNCNDIECNPLEMCDDGVCKCEGTVCGRSETCEVSAFTGLPRCNT